MLEGVASRNTINTEPSHYKVFEAPSEINPKRITENNAGKKRVQC